jgi:hypothetical protein|tara:strand:+ start:556 stop:807 length:252 start_codon:yes stop_codon:yes gene_type:complete
MKNLNNEKFSLRFGSYSSLGTKISPFGATVVLKRPSGSTHINFDNISEAVDTIKNHLAKYDTKCEIDALENRFIVIMKDLKEI